MYKRTWGYFLLTMLVLTGLGGRLHSDTFTGKERRMLINDVKAARKQLLQSIRELSKKQYEFKNEDGQSVQHCIKRLIATEAGLWVNAQASLQQLHGQDGMNMSKHSALNQELAVSLCATSAGQESVSTSSLHEAVEKFENLQDRLLRFLRTSTDDVHHHFVQTPTGRLDIFQLLLLDVNCMHYYLKQIEQIKNSRGYPEA